MPRLNIPLCLIVLFLISQTSSTSTESAVDDYYCCLNTTTTTTNYNITNTSYHSNLKLLLSTLFNASKEHSLYKSSIGPAAVALIALENAFIKVLHKCCDEYRDDLSGVLTAESLLYDFTTIEAATNCFSMENKIGVGGFGDVYKAKVGYPIGEIISTGLDLSGLNPTKAWKLWKDGREMELIDPTHCDQIQDLKS
ncbi:hypothetical protein HAX54_045821 [Datura stramonium]|uniref:Uncharacterized protein n=1 Tax=Datura stramonium TaxID=4076 RepID=A0ABS8SR89_DATST|nr:hypothetical protein [Datura stramonium]